MKDVLSYWLVLAIGVFFSAISEAIYFFLHRKEQKGEALTKKQVEWMQVMKFSRFFFLILVIALPPLMIVLEYISGLAFVIFVGIIFLIALFKKGGL